MYIVVLNLLLKNPALIALIPAVSDVFQSFKVKLAELRSLVKQKVLIITGLSKDKKNTKILLADLADFIAAAIHSFAYKSNNYTLLNEVNYTGSKLSVMRDSTLIETCNNIYEIGMNHLADLAFYNVDANTMQTLLTSITLYNDQTALPVAAIEHRKVLTAAIDEKQIELDDFKKHQMDTAMKLLKPTDKTFFNDYKAAGRIIDAGMRHKKDVVPVDPNAVAYMAGNISDADGNPLEDVTIEVFNEKYHFTTDTDEDGDYFVEGIPDGTYTIKISSIGKKTMEMYGIVFRANDEAEENFNIEDEVPPTES
jgi:hypothetical protein